MVFLVLIFPIIFSACWAQNQNPFSWMECAIPAKESKLRKFIDENRYWLSGLAVSSAFTAASWANMGWWMHRRGVIRAVDQDVRQEVKELRDDGKFSAVFLGLRRQLLSAVEAEARKGISRVRLYSVLTKLGILATAVVAGGWLAWKGLIRYKQDEGEYPRIRSS